MPLTVDRIIQILETRHNVMLTERQQQINTRQKELGRLDSEINRIAALISDLRKMNRAQAVDAFLSDMEASGVPLSMK